MKQEAFIKMTKLVEAKKITLVINKNQIDSFARKI